MNHHGDSHYSTKFSISTDCDNMYDEILDGSNSLNDIDNSYTYDSVTLGSASSVYYSLSSISTEASDLEDATFKRNLNHLTSSCSNRDDPSVELHQRLSDSKASKMDFQRQQSSGLMGMIDGAENGNDNTGSVDSHENSVSWRNADNCERVRRDPSNQQSAASGSVNRSNKVSPFSGGFINPLANVTTPLRKANISPSNYRTRYDSDSSSSESTNSLHESLFPNTASWRMMSISGRRPSNVKILSMDHSGSWRVLSQKGSKKRQLPSFPIMPRSVRRVINFPKRDPDFLLKIFVIVLFIVIVTTIFMVTRLYEEKQLMQQHESQIFFSDELRQYHLLSTEGKIALKVHYALGIPSDLTSEMCLSSSNSDNIYGPSRWNKFCRDWKYRAHLDINFERKSSSVACYHVHWTSLTDELRDCFEISNAYWYGIGQMSGSPWPLNFYSFNDTPFITGHTDSENSHNLLGSIIKRYFISSNGVAIHVPLSVPLYISFNASSPSDPTGDSLLCLSVKPSSHTASLSPYFDKIHGKTIEPHLDYSICTGPDLFLLHETVSRNWTRFTGSLDTTLPQSPANNWHKSNRSHRTLHTNVEHTTHPSTSSNASQSHDALLYTSSYPFINKIIWSTESIHHIPELNETTLLNYAESIISSNFSSGIILIDSRWERRVGELMVNPQAFANLPLMYKQLKEKNFSSLLTVSPFVGIGNPIIEQSSKEGRFLIDPSLSVPLLTKCFSGQKQDLCALIDILNSTSRNWLKERIKDRVISRHIGLDGIFFASIQSTLMPKRIKLFQKNYTEQLPVMNPDLFQVHYHKMGKMISSSLLGFDAAVGTSKKLFEQSAYYRMLPFKPTWKSLQTLIPNVLSVSLMGYQSINPGSVGGDDTPNLDTSGSYSSDTKPSPFDPELYIRWLQVSIFMPVLQLSSVPGSPKSFAPHLSSLNTTDEDYWRKKIQSIAHRLLELREKVIIKHIIRAIDESYVHSYPVIRGLFFLEPNMNDAYRITDEFSIGNNLLIAPILTKNVTTRHIYVPRGLWIDGITGETVNGGRLIEMYDVPLSQVAYFIRDESSSQPKSP